MKPVEHLFQDEHFVAINKQVPRTAEVDKPDSVADLVRTSLPAGAASTLYTVHRLDIPVTGILLYACSRRAASAIGSMFSEGDVEKRYLAAVSCAPPASEGVLEHYIRHDKRTNRAHCFDKYREGTRFCRTQYRVFGRSDRYWFVELIPQTGRTHQLRAQMAAIGCPVKGDRKYGARRGNRDRLVHLHSYRLSFFHPLEAYPVSLCAAPPRDPVWHSAMQQYSTEASSLIDPGNDVDA